MSEVSEILYFMPIDLVAIVSQFCEPRDFSEFVNSVRKRNLYYNFTDTPEKEAKKMTDKFLRKIRHPVNNNKEDVKIFINEVFKLYYNDNNIHLVKARKILLRDNLEQFTLHIKFEDFSRNLFHLIYFA